MEQYLRKKYPRSSFDFHDAAIGGTDSQLGMFRLERDVLAWNPNLVFLDFTANDDLTGRDIQHLAAYECLLREMIGRGIPVVQVFFAFKWNFGEAYRPETLFRYQDHRKLARAYGTAVGDSLPLVQQAITTGRIQMNTFWPFDNSHPDDCGYELFFEAVRDGLEQAIAEKTTCTVPIKPVFSDVYMRRRRLELVDLPLPSGWRRAKTYRTSLWFDGLSSRWMGDVVVCDLKDRQILHPLEVTFQGTFVGLLGESDQDSLSFRIFIDGKAVLPPKGSPKDAWEVHTRPFGGGRLFFWRVLSRDLPPGRHILRIEPILPSTATKGQLRIASVCEAGPTK